MQQNADSCNSGRGPHGASHPMWAFRREAVIWVGKLPVRPNIIPFAEQMKLWTQQKTNAVPLVTKLAQTLTCQPGNPYTYSLAAISHAWCASMNDAIHFSESTDDIDSVDAEISRIRYESELIIYSARFCEAAIKQILFCTNFHGKKYEKASMGRLLAQPCEACKKGGAKEHDISLLGALAHRYGLCVWFDRCAFDHLQIVAKRRNLEAAHSESQAIHPRTAAESKLHLANSLQEIGHELGHMADHIGEIEKKVVAELELCIRSYPNLPPIDALSNLPLRWLHQYYPELTTKTDWRAAGKAEIPTSRDGAE